MRKMVLVSLSLLFLASVLSAKEATDRFEKVVSRMVKAINETNWVGVQADFAQVMLDFLPLEKSTPFFQGMVAQYGKIEKLDTPNYFPPDKVVFPAHFEHGFLDITVVLDEQDKIIGLLFLPHKAQIQTVEKHQTELSLPFKDKWLVFWGGDTNELNLHHDVPNQQFAFDLVGADSNGKTRKGNDNTNEDYFAFGREIISPADGVVTDVINGVRDNVPGSMNPYSALGNAVFIQHRENEISALAHLKLNSIKVKVGDKVTRGQVLGLCGNSGNSSEPHLHYHLQNTPIIQDGTGIKCFFRKVIIVREGNEQQMTGYSPIKGDIISEN
ncbi:MAG: peptidoglycan DD-metalloendopeptidase family protein [Sedimentisphaerales bacterium]